MYEKTKEQLIAIKYPELVCNEAIYELYQDKNLQFFIDLLKKKYLYNKRIFISSKNKEYLELLHMLYEAVFKLFNKYSAKEIVKCCHVFSDYNGENLMYLIGIMAVIEEYFIIERLEELERKKQAIQSEKLEWMEEYNEKKKESLFVDEKEFLDEKKYLEYINNIFAKYNKEEHINKLKKLLEIASKESFKEIGKIYWENKRLQEKKMNQKMNELFNTILQTLKTNNKKG